MSHIGAGFLYNSPTAGKVRVDESYDMNIASSIFDYTNTSANGLVSNILYSFTPSIASPPSIFSDYVNPNFPLFTPGILEVNGAVFTGLTHRAKNGQVASVSTSFITRLLGYLLIFKRVVFSVPKLYSGNCLFDCL